MVDRLVHSEANRQRIEAVEKCFGGAGITLMIHGRVLVGEGILTKSCRKKFKKRQFFLFNDIMVYGNIVINKKKYNKQHVIPLEGVTLEDLQDQINDSNKNGWLIKTPHKSFAVYAATSTEKQEWMAHINKCIDELLKRTGKSPSSSHAAVWVPDPEAKLCMHCKKTQFTFLNRRHHCRNCGLVVCGNCSMRKELIPVQSNKPVRVCDTCFQTLCQRRLSGVVASPPTPVTTLTKPPQVKVVAAHNQTYNSVLAPTSLQTSNGLDAKEVETSDSDDDDFNDSSDGLNQHAAALTLEDQKPTFYSEVTEAVNEIFEGGKQNGQTISEKTEQDKESSNGTTSSALPVSS